MLSIPQIDNSSLLFPEGLLGGDRELETGGFDFLNYLLGLQTPGLSSPALLPEITPSEGNEESPLLSVGDVVGQSTSGDGALLSLFSEEKSAVDAVPTRLGELPEMARAGSEAAETRLDVLQTQKDPTSSVSAQNTDPGKGVFPLVTPLGTPKANSKNILQVDHTAKVEVAKPHEKVALSPEVSHWLASQATTKKESSSLGVAPEKSQRDAIGKYELVSAKSEAATPVSQQAFSKNAPLSGEVNKPTAPANAQVATEQVGHSKKRSGSSHAETGTGLELLSQLSTPKTSQPSTADISSKEGVSYTVPQLMDKVGTLSQNGGGKMTVRLTPPELGEVEVQVTTRGNRVEVEMRSESGDAKSLLEARLHDLKEAMQDNDLVLSKIEVQVSRESSTANEMVSDHFSSGQPFSHTQFGSGQREMGQPQQFSQPSRTTTPSFSGIRSASETHTPYVNRSEGKVDLRI